MPNCPQCNSTDLYKAGYYVANNKYYQRYECRACRATFFTTRAPQPAPAFPPFIPPPKCEPGDSLATTSSPAASKVKES